MIGLGWTYRLHQAPPFESKDAVPSGWSAYSNLSFRALVAMRTFP